MRPICVLVQVAIACCGCQSNAGTPRAATPSVQTMACGKINGKAAKTLRFPGQVKGRLIDGKQARARFVAPKALGVTVGRARVRGKRIELSALLRNTSERPFDLVVNPYGGSFPYGGDSPLGLGFSAEASKAVTYSGKRYPPAPPMPMLITIPAARCVQFDAHVDLSNYTYKGSPKVTLSWAFYYFRGVHPKGTVAVRLPGR